jgi:hypothetical protein
MRLSQAPGTFPSRFARISIDPRILAGIDATSCIGAKPGFSRTICFDERQALYQAIGKKGV